MEVMFSPLFVCWFVCLSVCSPFNAKTTGRICLKFYGGVGHGPRTNWLVFDPDPDSSGSVWIRTSYFLSMSPNAKTTGRICLKLVPKDSSFNSLSDGIGLYYLRHENFCAMTSQRDPDVKNVCKSVLAGWFWAWWRYAIFMIALVCNCYLCLFTCGSLGCR